MLKHYRWSLYNDDGLSYDGGRIAVKVEDDRFQLVQLAGQAPPFDILTRLFGDIDPIRAENDEFQAPLEEFLERGMELHKHRQNRWAVQLSTGMSGRTTALLRIEKDRNLGDFPIAARLHVSMYGKLNEGFGPIWLGDIPPLLDRMAYDSSAKIAAKINLDQAVIFAPPEKYGWGGDSDRANPNAWQTGGVMPHTGWIYSPEPDPTADVKDMIDRAAAEGEAATE